MQIRELTNIEFIQFTEYFNQSSVYQTPEYAMSMSKQNYDTLYLGMINSQNEIVAASVILIEMLGKFLYAYAPRGFLIDYNNEELVKEFSTLIKKHLRKKNIIAIKISPMIIKSRFNKVTKNTEDVSTYDKTFKMLRRNGYYHLGYNNFFEAFKPRFEAIIELNKNVPTMFNKIHKKYRTKIRSSDKSGIRIYKGTEDNLKYFYELVKKSYPRNLKYFQDLYTYHKDRNMIDLYIALLDSKQYLMGVQRQYEKQAIACNKITEKIFKNQGKANNSLIDSKIVEDNKFEEIKKKLIMATNFLHENPDGIITAGAIIIKHKKEAYLLMDGHDPKYKTLNAKHLLIWKLMEKYASEGYETLNLGGISNPDVKKNPYAGLNDFKLGFGADAVEYIGDLELITSKPLYMMYRNYAQFRKKPNAKKKEE